MKKLKGVDKSTQTIKENYEELIDEIKSLNKYDIGSYFMGQEVCGGPSPDGEYIELEEVIKTIRKFVSE